MVTFPLFNTFVINECASCSYIADQDFPSSGRKYSYVTAMKNYYFQCHRLLAFSFALQQILRSSTNSLDILPYFLTCYQSATQVLKVAREQLQGMGCLQYAPDHIFINVSYAAVFLLKLLRPELAEFTDTSAILTQVHEIVETFETCAVDSVHTPKLYAGFLRVLLQAKQGKDDDVSKAGSRSGGQIGLDPELTSKLFQDQQQSQRQLLFQQNQNASQQAAQHQVPLVEGITDSLNGLDPNNQAFNSAWNLDQLGQSGFWENLSMRTFVFFFSYEIPFMII